MDSAGEPCEDRGLSYLGIFVAVLAAITVAGYLRVWTWTGFRAPPDDASASTKTLWDWMQLLIVPLVLAAGAYGINSAQTSRDADREDQRAAQQDKIAAETRREGALQTYLQQMTGLIVDKKLAQQGENVSIVGLASSLTLAVLRQLDGRRKGEVVQFLADAQLIKNDAEGEGGSVVVVLYRANLRGAQLRDADLNETYFGAPDLAGADLSGAVLDGADFSDSNLREADFSDTGVAEGRAPNFSRSCLTGARFERALLPGAVFAGAQGRGVDFSGASFEQADFEGARLTDIDGRDAEYGQATNETLPEGWGARGLPMTAKEKAALCQDLLGVAR